MPCQTPDMRRAGPALGGALALAVAMSIGRFAYTPILPFMRDADGLSTSAAGWIASANYVGYLAGAATARRAVGVVGPRSTMRVGLAASALTTAAMALTSAPVAWAGLRFLGGLASAWAMIAVSSMVLAAAGANRRWMGNLMFSGVGTGIIASTLLVALSANRSSDPEPMWLLLGVASVVGSIAADRLVASVPTTATSNPPRAHRTPLPPVVRNLVASYTCSGFGYVVTATYLVLIVRDSDLGRTLEVVTWCVVGAFAAVSTWAWNRVGAWRGERPALVVAHLGLAAGVMSAAFVPGTAGAVVGAALLGFTFAGITGVGIDLAGRLHPDDPTRAMAVMTTAFAIGQIAGPAIGGWLADITGTFRVPSVVAAVVLLVGAAILMLPSARVRPAAALQPHSVDI